MNAQLPLEIKLQDDFTLENFFSKNNTQLLSIIKQFFNDKLDTPFIYLWGAKGSGKSHLLQACCQAEQSKQGIYLPLSLIHNLGPSIFENISSYPLICIDDLDIIAGDKVQEEACFHLYNQIISNSSSKLIIAACQPPNNLPFSLADLKSRLNAGLIFQMEELADEDKQVILQHYCEKRGFFLATHIAQFLLTHCSRNLHNLLEMIEILDKASLAAKRRITLSFVKATLKL